MKKLIIVSLILSLGILLNACSKRVTKTYTDQQQKVLLPYYDENFAEAFKQVTLFAMEIEKSTKQDLYVALLERGKIALEAGQYDVAIRDLQDAEKRFLDIEGTISLKEEFGSKLLDETTREYEAEPLEKIMISPYLTLAYLGKKDVSGFRVERNRTMMKIQDYIDNTYKAEYLENPFARYLAAVLYEKDGKYSDAKIELEKIQKTKHLKEFAAQELSEIKKGKSAKKADLVTFIDLGRSPMKFEKAHKAQVGNVWLTAVYPEFRARNFTVKKTKVLVDGKEVGESFTISNISKIILDQFKKNEPAIIKAVIARMATKGGTQVAGSAMQKSKDSTVKMAGAALNIFGKVSSAIERADTRCWLALPAEIQVLRTRMIGEGKHTVQLVYLSATGAEIGKSAIQEVEVKDGDISIVHFRVVK